ncbi:Bro-N domain-containing protein [Methanobrevibacter sp. TMH8]|uniref:BRO-N domain-containing protein n=1 Tax=Methanobrevibacter sp. TMH8 TaxID=2848611 RepID=UPI001CCD919C|nr:Bro-N domain-containing protein [Methanobrevibacter sp. TMH8]MBZ9570547.1 Bro-N domain-containing protein [Methanobrevibacter sp. TMH8]
MDNKNQIKIFKDQKIRSKWNNEEEEWYFSVIDVVGVLSQSKNPKNYWKVLKHRLKKEGSQVVTNCNHLKMLAPDGKYYKTDVANTEQILRIIQSIPSPNAEPFKRWLAKIGKEHLDEIADPQLAIERAISNYRKKGYSEEWITQRLKTIELRKELTAEWDRAGVEEGLEYAILTDEITKAWSGMTTNQYKQFKDIKKENLRDNMSDVELVLNMLAEVSTTQISKSTNPEGFEESKKIANEGGTVAGNARKDLETRTGESVLTRDNANNPKLLDKNKKIQ